MPNLAVSNRAQLSYKLEGDYPNNFGVPQAGNGTLLNMTGESLSYDTKNESSKQIRADGQVPDIVQTDATTQGGFTFEQQYREYDPFFETIMKGPFVALGTNGITTASTGTLTPTSSTVLTASVAYTGNDAFTQLHRGQWFRIHPVAGASAAVRRYLNSRVFRASTSVSPTSTVITLDASTPIDTAIITAPLAAGWRISTSRVYNAPANPVLKSYTLEVQHQDVGQYRQYTGCIASKVDLKLDVGGIITGSFEFMGKSFNLLQASSMGSAAAAQSFTPANATKGVFDIFEGGQAISASTFIKSFECTVDNSLRIQGAVGVFGAAGIATGTMNITGKLEVYFADAALYTKFLDGSASSISVPVLDVDGNGYVLHFPQVKYTATKVNAGGLDEDTMLMMDFQALPDTVVGSATLGKSFALYRVGA